MAEHGQTIVAIERATDVLSMFTETEDATLGVTEIATRLGLSKAVVYRILSSFRAKGYVDVDEETRRYSLGPKALDLGLAYMNRLDVRAVARPEMEGLSRETYETSTLSLRTGWTRVYVDQVTPERDIKMVVTLGQHAPLHAGASSKAFLAFLEPGEIDDYLGQPLERLTAATITTPRTLRAELEEIRARGYAASRGERMEGAASVAAPVFGADARPAGVISVCGPAERFRDEAEGAARLLLAATGRVSRALGHRAQV